MAQGPPKKVNGEAPPMETGWTELSRPMVMLFVVTGFVAQ